MLRNRIILIILWILSLIGISFYGGSVSYGFFTAVTLVPVISFLYLLLVFLRFKIFQKMDNRHVVAGQTSDFYITLQNEDRFPFASIRILFYSPFSEIRGVDDKEEYELLPRTGIKKRTTLMCKYRGEYEVGVKEVIIRDFFNIFKMTYKNKEPFRVTVLPKIVVPDSINAVDENESSSVDSKSNPCNPEPVVREYVPGDDARMIHWKASAGKGKLFVRTLTGEDKNGIGIVMDPVRYSDDPPIYLPVENKICETVIALAMYYMNNNTPVNVYTYSENIASVSVRDTDGFNYLYRSISSYRFGEKEKQDEMFVSISEISSIWDSKMVILVLHEAGPEAWNLMKLLNRSSISVAVYLVGEGASEISAPGILPRTRLYAIDPEADLKEAL